LKIRNKQGVALISVLLILTIMMSLTLGFVWYTMQDHFISVAHQHSNACTYLAQAGVEYVLYLMKHNMMIFPSAPYSDNVKQYEGAEEYQQDEPHQGIKNGFYTWVGRREAVGNGANNSSNILNINWGKGTNPNNYDDFGVSGKIDATEENAADFCKLSVDHHCIDNTTSYKPGEIINLFRDKNDQGNNASIEFLLISRLTLSSNENVGVELGNTNACGSFKIRVDKSSNDSGGKYYFVQSTGTVKTVPNSEMSKDPSLWQIQDETLFIPVSNRTIYCKIPYFQSHFIVLPDNKKTNGYWPKFENNILNMEYVITPDQWFYKFR